MVLDINGYKCKSNSDDCSLKLVPDNICINFCDTNIYKLSDDSKSCGFCEYFNNTKPYRLIKTYECLGTMPEGTQFYIENYTLLECAKGYQFDSENKIFVPNCYPLSLKCNDDYCENSTNHNSINCKEGYNLNGTNCEEIVIDAILQL